ncbi:conserved hypothetical protein [Leishmania mexicana MHOM/GT/2001/U1103]|uniref:Uncharacterized protein n=1 Tax=Leishmania mexicana (strain MHOM/GT/2001/U1103) TaxID=929439 RepID=E9ASI8_LEIMU|nr:conserved hypothetical protein [Leishmania mexicana MHOM/GT/2001/U1103]CBZ25911.1 conserved hypothetical protein [Leishmania mexicana MHOM/GT/2001/U1103]
MFADLLATTSCHAGDRSSDVVVSPVSPPFSPRCTSASSSAGSSSGCRRRPLSDDGDGGSYPRVSPFVGTAYPSAHPDGRARRPGFSECLSPLSIPEGCASSTTAMVSSSSSHPEGHSLSLGGTSEPPPRESSGDTPGNTLEGYIPTSDSFSSHRGDSARPPPSSTPTLSLYDHGQQASEVASSTPSRGATALLPEDGASPALDSVESSANGAGFVVMRSGTREGGQQSPQLFSSSKSSPPSSMPCAPPLGQPTAGAVVVEKYAPALQTPASPLRFSVLYTEEEHRVRLETRETEERRCLYQAHKAVLSVYHMWTAAGADADYGDGDRLLLTSSRMGDGASTRFLEDNCYPKAPNTPNAQAAGSRAQPSALATATAANAVATERVRSFLKSSIDSARGRRCVGAGQEGDAAICVLPHRSTTIRITYADSDAEALRGSPGHGPHPQASHSSSPAASRMLDYSSVHMPGAASSLMHTSSEPPSLVHQARLFSPWRATRTDQHDAAVRRAVGKPDVHLEPRTARDDSRGLPQRRPRTSLVPHLVSTSPAAVHLSSASHSLGASSAALRRRGLLEPRLSADTAAPREDLPRSAVLPAARAAAAARAPSPSLRAVLSAGVGSFSSPSAAQRVGGPDASRGTSSRAWNGSVNLVSTSAASRRISPFAGDDTTNDHVAGGSVVYASNESFRLRQRAALSGTSSGELLSSPLHGIDTDRRTLLAVNRLKDHRRERLSSYVHYKRFFDAVYGEQSASPLASRELDGRHSSAGRTSPAPSRTVRTRPSMSFDVGDGDKHARAWPWRSSLSSSLYPRARSPELVARRDLRPFSPRGSTAATRSAASPSKVPTTFCARLTGAAASLIVPTDTTLFAARLTRLSTLEKLCRAELQRRCMEDQSLLLHHFIVEGTATLQRGGRATAPLHRHRQRAAGRHNGGVPNALGVDLHSERRGWAVSSSQPLAGIHF